MSECFKSSALKNYIITQTIHEWEFFIYDTQFKYYTKTEYTTSTTYIV